MGYICKTRYGSNLHYLLQVVFAELTMGFNCKFRRGLYCKVHGWPRLQKTHWKVTSASIHVRTYLFACLSHISGSMPVEIRCKIR